MKKLLLLVATMLAFVQTWAHDFEVDGIYYNITSTDDKTVSVTHGNLKYTGSVVIPESITYNGNTYSVTSIGDWAFEYCSGLTSVTIPNSVTSIGEYVFYDCSGLTSVTIPNSVTSISCGAFNYVKNIVYNGSATGSPWGALTQNGVFDGDFIYSDAEKTQLTAYIGNGGDVVIPESVTSIGEDAFSDCSGLTSVTIPNSVTSIEGGAFSNCSGLTSVTIPNSVTSIGGSAFYGCSGLTSVTIPNSVTSIGKYVFYDCSGLTSVTIPDSVTNIGEYAFSGCSGLTSVTIPNSVTSIGGSAFIGCSGLTSVTIPNSVTSIEWSAFEGCSGLTSVTIGNSVTSIGNYAFEDCSSLTSVTIPESVTSIGRFAFIGCSGLTSVTIPESVTSIGDGAFYGCNQITIYCEAGSKPTGWDNNWNPDDRPVVWNAMRTIAVNANNDEFGIVAGAGKYVYGTEATLMATPTEHYHFVKWSDANTENPRTITIATDTTITAVFAIDTLKVTVTAENGTVAGAGEYAYGTEVTLTATPTEHYHFVKWSDANTENPRTITIATDTTITAAFAIDTLNVTVTAENGTVAGAGEYAYGTEATLTATPTEGYHFVKWSNGSTDPTITITVDKDINLTAEFAINENQGNTEEGGETPENPGESGNQGGETPGGESPENPGNNETPEEPGDAVAEDAATAVSIYAYQNVIVVEGANSDIMVYDAIGRLVARRNETDNRIEIPMQTAGIYIVKVGNEAKRVMVQ